MNKKGFTLVELLGVIVILSIVMLIAIPNISSTLERSKRDQYITDAKKMISLAEYELRKGEIAKPSATNLLKIELSYLATTDLEKDPDGKEYDIHNSYVIVSRKDGVLTYHVNLVSNHGSKYWGIKLAEQDELSSDQRYNKISKNITLLSDNQIKTELGFTTAAEMETKKSS